jgi:hypothetical protein
MTESTRHHVVLLGLDDELARRLVLLLGPFDVDFVRLPWGRHTQSVITRAEFDLILALCPGDGSRVRERIEEYRAPSSRSRHSAIVLFADSRSVLEARRLIGRGVNHVVPLYKPQDLWQDTVLSLLDVARRFDLRTAVEVTAELDGSPLTAACLTENVSLSGMLVNCSHEVTLPVGATLSFAMAVPGDEVPIRGRACVARTTDPRRERVEGIGARFVSFSESDQSRLRSVLSRQAS